MAELVIKISDEIYQSCVKECEENPALVIDTFTYAIGTGTPLPKGHGILKDIDHYIKMQWEHPDYSLTDDEPTIIEADKEIKYE